MAWPRQHDILVFARNLHRGGRNGPACRDDPPEQVIHIQYTRLLHEVLDVPAIKRNLAGPDSVTWEAARRDFLSQSICLEMTHSGRLLLDCCNVEELHLAARNSLVLSESLLNISLTFSYAAFPPVLCSYKSKTRNTESDIKTQYTYSFVLLRSCS